MDEASLSAVAAENAAEEDWARAAAAIEAIDREVEFYRKRAGQVFFFSLLVEVLILAGRESIQAPELWMWLKPLLYSIMFIAVAAVGSALGAEYRRRIHILKNHRSGMMHTLAQGAAYPRTGGLKLSEIEMLYVVLVFLSSGGLVISWLRVMNVDEPLTTVFWWMFWFFQLLAACGLGWVAWKSVAWMRRRF